ncbi:MAG: MmgE/PrpD family protein [Chloroflexi bacterium]|nr:MmgE/PrpD family protein [Chloroflexota bacterium]
MTLAENLAKFVARAEYRHLSPQAVQALKIRILDSLGCAIGAVEGEPVRMIREHIADFDGAEHCTLIGGGRAAPDRASFYNAALVRYLDFNDSYLAKGETCHPSDNLGAVLAACEYAKGSGRDLITSLAVAYQVQCRLSDVAPVRARGFDHTTQGSFAVAAGVSKALGLDVMRAANALAIAGTAFNALRVTRTGSLSHWKGLAYPNTAFGGTHAAFLAMRGITGPPEVFEGNKGFMETISGKFQIDWSKEDLERVRQTIIKKYNAEIHSQSSIEGLLELKKEAGFTPRDIERIEIEIFDVAFNIIGGGEEGDKTVVRTKEEADHSLQYMLAVALFDGQVMPQQYRAERIRAQDVQDLLRRIKIQPRDDYSQRFPAEMPSRTTVFLKEGKSLVKEKADYEGFHTRPMTWETVVRKFNDLSKPYAADVLRRGIVKVVANLEELPVSDLAQLLARVRIPRK